GERRIERGRRRIVVEIHGDEGARVVVEDALELLRLGGGFHDRVYLVDRGGPRGHEGEIHERDVDGGHADRVAVELAVQLGEHEADRGRGARLPPGYRYSLRRL